MNLTFLLLSLGGQGGQDKGISTVLMFAVIIVVFYFFMIRPQRKRQKEEKAFRDSLQKGQKIRTVGGLHGKVCEVKETTVVVEFANDVRIEVDKAAIVIHGSPNQEPAK
ncbi:MAG: preprotein translocase subunit YajC [Bacteroidales bacterium]|jgi:preprotein translocase subunit YajC|nr:preprotein translocase subunit YajC [Bacteroidales bacterium]